MGKPSTLTTFVDRIRSGAIAHASGRDSPKDRPTLPISQPSSTAAKVEPTTKDTVDRGRAKSRRNDNLSGSKAKEPKLNSDEPAHAAVEKSIRNVESSTSADTKAAGEEPPALDEPAPPDKKTITQHIKHGTIRFGKHTKNALLHSYINVLLIFVPMGIAVEFAHLSPAIIFAMNAVAIIPLAGLLTHATETVAASLGDTLGALLNVSFGNAVELIIFIIALVKNEIRIVQASLLGSILANLLLILGMAFLLGGLRYREQIYNSTVTQMSACLLSLSVMSLLLPTAFHASFSKKDQADKATLKISRGTSVILLLVYILYLLFQLKSHAYLYQSMPQEKIDEESHPGVLHDILDTSSSDSSTSSSSDSDTTSGSHTTAGRIKRAFRHRKRRKSSATTDSTPSMPSHLSSPTVELTSMGESRGSPAPGTSRRPSVLDAIMSGDEGDNEGFSARLDGISKVRDFEASAEAVHSPERTSSPESHKFRFRKRKHKKRKSKKKAQEDHALPEQEQEQLNEEEREAIHRVGFVDLPRDDAAGPGTAKSRRPRPGLPKLLSQNVFVDPVPSQLQRPRTRRASSLPDLSRAHTIPGRGFHPSYRERAGIKTEKSGEDSDDDDDEAIPMSRTAAVVMLLVSTGLVALCAEFLVDAIPAMTTNSSVSQAFIGLIILPIVGNAAEHVTAVTVAAKNKMDLAIGVAVGSSIQIALFVTPLVVILGWAMGRDMSLYFTLFETISLFVTAFVVNFLVLDGRSNYLEGTLLIACYIIIAVAAFFYPDSEAASELGGAEGATNSTVEAHVRMAIMLLKD